MNIREADKNDIDKGLWEIINTFGSTNPSTVPKETQIRLFDESLTSSKIFVCLDGERIVGTAKLLIERKFHHGGAAVGHIEDVVVDEGWRGKGVGSLLVQKLKEEARKPEHNIYKIILDCKDSLVNFYSRNGFKVQGTEMSIYL